MTGQKATGRDWAIFGAMSGGLCLIVAAMIFGYLALQPSAWGIIPVAGGLVIEIGWLGWCAHVLLRR